MSFTLDDEGWDISAGCNCNSFQPHTDSYGEGGKHVKTSLLTEEEENTLRELCPLFNHNTLAPVSSREQLTMLNTCCPPDVSEIASAQLRRLVLLFYCIATRLWLFAANVTADKQMNQCAVFR